MKQMDIDTTDGTWKMVDDDVLRENGYFPNRIIWRAEHDGRKTTVIVIKQTAKPDADGDYAVNAAALFDVARAKSADQITGAYVVLLDQNGNKINRTTVLDLKSRLNGSRMIDGKHGPYFWVDENFEPVRPRNGVGLPWTSKNN